MSFYLFTWRHVPIIRRAEKLWGRYLVERRRLVKLDRRHQEVVHRVVVEAECGVHQQRPTGRRPGEAPRVESAEAS